MSRYHLSLPEPCNPDLMWAMPTCALTGALVIPLGKNLSGCNFRSVFAQSCLPPCTIRRFSEKAVLRLLFFGQMFFQYSDNIFYHKNITMSINYIQEITDYEFDYCAKYSSKQSPDSLIFCASDIPTKR